MSGEEETGSEDQDTDQGNGAETQDGGSPSVDPARLFRQECLISDVDLRVDIAYEIQKTVIGGESVELQDKIVNGKANFSYARGGRETVVRGSYTRDVTGDESYAMGVIGAARPATLTETVSGGVNMILEGEHEAILGGAYLNTLIGAYLRTCVWSDGLFWGGWVETDVVRVEMAALSIRSYMGYAHVNGARVVLAHAYIDDYMVRTEIFGAFIDRETMKADVCPPGSGTTLEA